MLERTARLYPDKGITDINSEGKKTFISYKELEDVALRVAYGLKQKGVKKGDKVIILCDCNEMYYFALWGCFMGGIIPAPMTAPKTFSSSSNEIKSLKSVWETMEKPLILSTKSLIDNISLEYDDFTFEDINEIKNCTQKSEVETVNPDQVAVLMFTSGSTGHPKGVMQTHINLANKQRAAVQFSGYDVDDVFLNWFSIEHVVGLIAFHIMPLYLGANQIQISTDYILEQPLRWMDYVTEYKATITWAPNSLFALLNDSIVDGVTYNWKLEILKRVINAGESVNNETCRKFLKNLMPYGLNKLAIKPEWGMSETCCMTIASDVFCDGNEEGIEILNKNHLEKEVVFCNDTDFDKVVFVECGKIYPGLEMRITDNDMNVLNECEIGRFQVRGKMVLPGYYNNPELNKASFTDDGWFDTGDLAFIKNDSVTFTGRMKDIIIINGINYQNVDIETSVEEVEDVDVSFTAACAVKVNGESTDSVAVFYVPFVSGHKRIKRQIEKIKENIFSTMGLKARYILPVTREDIPKTNIGKIQRSKLVIKFQAGEFDELVKKLDIILDSEDVIRPWFFTDEKTCCSLPKKENLDDKKLVILNTTNNIPEKLVNEFTALGAQCYEATDKLTCANYLNEKKCTDIIEFVDLSETKDVLVYLDQQRELFNAIETKEPVRQFIVVSQKEQAGILLGYIKSLNQEEPNYQASVIVLEESDYTECLKNEINFNKEDEYVSYQSNHRYINTLNEVDIESNMLAESKIKNEGKYIVAGGFGGIGELVSHLLLEQFQANLLLIGRTPLDKFDEAKEIKFKKLLQLSDTVEYIAADIATEQGMDLLSKKIEEKWNGKIDGIFNLAGIGTFSSEYDTESHYCRNEKNENYQKTFAAKVNGTINLSKLLKKDMLYINFGSINSYFGGVGYSGYSAANSFMSGYTQKLKKEGYENCYCLNWSAWNGVGMSKNSMFTHAILEKGFIPLMATQALYSMIAVLRTDLCNVYIGLDSTNYNINKRIYDKKNYEIKSILFSIKENEIKAQEAKNANLVDEIILLDKVERDENGTLDLNRLYYIMKTQDEDELVELETETEKKLAKIWSEILNVDKIGKNNNFFSLGGHSLNVTRLTALIKLEFGVKIQAKDIFQQALLGKLAARIYLLQQNGVEDEDLITITQKEHYDLSYAQKRVFLLENLEKQKGLYTIVSAWNMKGKLKLNYIQKAIEILVTRHEMLRTTFDTLDGEPIQIVHDDMKIPFVVASLVGLPQNMKAQKIEEIIQVECMRKYDLKNGPLMYCSVIKKEENDIIFIISQHHIISDGWSFGVLVNELNEIYAALTEKREIKLTPVKIPVVNYVEWKNQKVLEDKAEKDFWMNKLKDNLEVLDLPVNYTRKEIQTYNGDTISFDITKEEKLQLQEFCKKNSCTMFMTMLASYYVLLYKLTSQNHIIVGIPVAGREDDATKNMMGMFVNSLAVPNVINEQNTISEFVTQVKNSILEVFEHQEYPFDKLVDDINPVRDLGRTPIFQTMFNYLNVALTPNLKGIDSEEYIVHRKVSKFDLSVNILDLKDIVNVSFEYNTDLFDGDSIRRWMGYFATVLKQMISQPKVIISNIDMVSKEEYKTILAIKDNKTEYPKDKSLAEVFAKIAKLNGDKQALVCNNKGMTYRELNEKSDSLAYVLMQKGIKAGDKIAIDVERDMDTIVGVLAIIKCGGAYVPLNKKYSKSVIEHMLQDCKVKYLVTGSKDRKLTGIEIIDLSATYEPHTFTYVKGSNHDAYVIYTSGSTGLPKGVVVKNNNILRLVKNPSWITFNKDDVILQTGALSFDASTFEIWGALLNGLKLVLVDEDCILDSDKLKVKIKDNKVTIMWVSAPLFNQLVESNSKLFTGCRMLLVGGDVLSVKHINMVIRNCPGIVILNGYGPTENTTFSTTFLIDKEFERNIPIGKPISNSSAYIVNKNMKLQPIGVVGELVVGGDGVAKGYLNNEEMEKKVFIDNPFVQGEKAYKTGDYVRMLKDGNIQFIGRIDNQVKIRGFRIELDAIKNVLLSYKGITDCVVAVQKNQANKLVVAYVTGSSDINKSDTLDYLKKNIADYMVPSKLIVVENIPLNTNGKVDMAKLEQLKDEGMEEMVKEEIILSDVEKKILEVFRSVLKNNQYGVKDSFFEWGGDSLLTIKLSSRLKALGYHIEPKLIFMYQSVRELSAELTTDNDDVVNERKPKDYLIKIHNGDEKKPKIFFMPPAGGTILGYIELCRHFKRLGDAYGVQAPGLYEDEQPQYLSFDEMVDFCLEAIKDKYDPETDYIAGHSLGGHFAYAMCHKFIEKGIQPKGLLVIDTTPSLDKIAQTQNQDINENDFKIFVLTMGIGNMLNGDAKQFENMTYEQIKQEIIKMSQTDETVASFMNEDYLDKYLKMQLHHILLSREVKLPMDKIDLPIDVIRTTAHEDSVKELFLEWENYSSNRVNIQDFDANHTSMMKLPYVIKLAKLIENIILK